MIKIIADTTCSLPQQELSELGLEPIPQIIIFGNDSYRDDTEIDTPLFLQKLRAAPALPKTAAPPPALYAPIFDQYAQDGNTLVVIAPTADMSGTLRSATVAAQDYPGADIRIIDTRTIAGGLGSIVRQAQAWAADGIDADTLVARVKDLAARERVYFIVDTLEYLFKGGRIGGAQALFGSLLQIKPILTLENGRAEAAETQRTKRRAIERVKELVLADCPRGPEALLTVSHCDAEDEAQAIAADFARELGVAQVPVWELPPAIVVHAGPKTISISYFHAAQ